MLLSPCGFGEKRIITAHFGGTSSPFMMAMILSPSYKNILRSFRSDLQFRKQIILVHESERRLEAA
jgi:hypothetical protein